MPFGRRRFKRRRGRRHFRRFKRRRGGRRVFRKIFRKLKEVKPEMKHTAFGRALTPFGTGTNGVCISGITEGAAVNQRIGRKVLPRRMDIKLHIVANDAQDEKTAANDADPTQWFRLFVVQIIQPKAQGDTVESTDFLSEDTVNSHYSTAPTFHPYKVLWDKKYVVCKPWNSIPFLAGTAPGVQSWVSIPGIKGAATGGLQQTFKTIKIRLPRKVINYDGTLSTSIHTHSVWIMGESGVGNDIAPEVEWNARFWYTDV